MKKIKGLIIALSIFIISGIFSLTVFGAQTFTMTVSGPSTATKGSNITLTYTASNLGSITNGFDGYEGYINYDSSKLEFVSATNSVDGWVIYTSKLTNKIKFMGYDDNPPNNAKSSDTQIFKATFKVLSTASNGDTTLTMDTIKGSSGSGTKIVGSDFSKTITIGEPEAEKSSNANLSSLTLTSNGNVVALSPAFNKATTSYTVNVTSDVEKVNVAAVLEDSKAKIVSGLGEKTLSYGNNSVSVVVQAENGSTKTYNVNIVRKSPLSSDSSLSNLTVDGHTLSPAFDPNTTSYKVTIPNDETSIDVNAIVNDPNAKVTITGNKNLSVGKNNIIVEVVAQDGSKRVYTIEATRKPSSNVVVSTPKSSNANLKSISGVPGLIFSSDQTTYDVVVPFETTELDVSALPVDPKAKVSITNSKLSNLEVGKTRTVTIVVTAEDSSVKVYTINVKRSEYESETDLKEFIVNDKDLLIEEDDDGTYDITVDKDTDELDISAIPKSEGSKVKIKGNENLKSGKNTVLVEVTDKNGFTKSYTLDVYKEEDSGILSFFKDYWILLLLGLLILLLLFLIMFLNRNNKTIIYNNNTRIVDNKKLPPENYLSGENPKQLEYLNDNLIDNDQDILYNSSDNSKIIEAVYEPRHAEEDDM